MPIKSDNPIRTKGDDVLDRAKCAKDFVSIIRDVDVSEGAIIGIVGSWGSGKTSFINLVREHLESEKSTTPENSTSDVQMIDFNPWLFSGVDDLVRVFLADLSSVLKVNKKYRDVVKSLVPYADLISSLAGAPPVGAPLYRFFRKKQNIADSKRNVEKKLRKQTTRLVVVIDDIDRLSAREVREMFRCIRLVAAFPNIIYVVAFDWHRTVLALDDTVARRLNGKEKESSWGQDYLEKIVQVKYNIPEINLDILHKQCERELGKALGHRDGIPESIAELYLAARDEVVKPLIRNMRDVRRLASAIRTKIVTPNELIPVPYLIALEAVRIFLPETFAVLCSSVDNLTRRADGSSEDASCRWHAEKMIKAANDKNGIVRDFLLAFFPASFDYLVTNRAPEYIDRIEESRRVLKKSGILDEERQKQILKSYLGIAVGRSQ